METTFDDSQRRQLAAIFERGAADASAALSRWLDRTVRLTISAVVEVDLAAAPGLLGPEDRLVAACVMQMGGRLDGLLLLVFEDRAGLALADILLRQPIGTSTSWGDLERSAAMETANIVGCAYLNSLATHLPETPEAEAGSRPVVPSPPSFRHEFAGSLLQFALMEQAIRQDRLLLIRTLFEADRTELDWSLLLVPSGDSLATLATSLPQPETP